MQHLSKQKSLKKTFVILNIESGEINKMSLLHVKLYDVYVMDIRLK